MQFSTFIMSTKSIIKTLKIWWFGIIAPILLLLNNSCHLGELTAPVYNIITFVCINILNISSRILWTTFTETTSHATGIGCSTTWGTNRIRNSNNITDSTIIIICNSLCRCLITTLCNFTSCAILADFLWCRYFASCPSTGGVDTITRFGRLKEYTNYRTI